MSEKTELLGGCGEPVKVKTWRRGHSIKCARRGSLMIRYWSPDPIEAEVADFCRTCRYLKEAEATTNCEFRIIENCRVCLWKDTCHEALKEAEA